MANVLFVLGTAREGRNSKKVFDYVLSVAGKRSDIESIPVDILDFLQSGTLGLPKDKLETWSNLVSKTDAIVIVSPEYNHGYPGELKLLLDSEYEAYKGKPVAICGVSVGSLGGARMVEQLKLVLNALQMIVLNTSVYFSNVNELFDKNNKIKDSQFWDKRIDEMFDSLVEHIK
ncbi:MAG: NAD(P)H-dependent oxidoreductase [Patescibacteria group bacterium]|nr:NAD(P)H-dependent oxidoreductase [Patescibacteria group bacterium]